MATSLRSLSFAVLVLAARAVLEPRAVQRWKPGKLFYLFMAKDHISHADLWGAFFSRGTLGVNYEALLHCKDKEQCEQAMQESSFQPTLIPTVPSQYCSNLVSPMIALLESALRLPASRFPNRDKFVFVSDSTLPAKPFWAIHHMLTGTPSSRFCLTSRMTGRPYRTPSGMDGSVIVKASQWFTANRKHSQQLVDTRYKYDEFMKGWRSWDLRMGTAGCVDEYFFFYSLFGLFNSTHCSLDEWKHTECAEAIEHDFDDLTLACDTYARWGEDVIFPPNQTGLPTTSFSSTPSEHGGVFGPGVVTEFSTESLQAWRRSPYAFMRKVEDDVRFVADGAEEQMSDAYTKHVFEEA